MKITISVTEEDIREAEEARERYRQAWLPSHGCPISRAARRALSDPGTTVGTDGICTDAAFYAMPAEARHFVRCFDDRLPVKPFSFDAEDIPE